MSRIIRIADHPKFHLAIEPHPWDLPPEANQDEGWDASEWQAYADAFEYRPGPFTFDEIVSEVIGDAGSRCQ